MRVKVFVSLSSLALFGWLTATFVRVVPMDTYDGPSATAQVDAGKLGEAVMTRAR